MPGEAAATQQGLPLESILRKAVEHHNAGRLSEAEELYHSILDRTPEHADSLHLLGMIAHQKGNSTEAELLIRRAIAVDVNVAAFHFDLGIVLKKMGRRNEAVACYHRALSIDPEMAEAFYNLGNELAAKGEYDEAVSHYKEAIKLQPRHSYAHNNLSLVLRSIGQTEEALKHAQESLRINPRNVEAYNNLGVLFSNSGQLERSITTLEKAAALRPDYTEAHWNMALPLLQLGDFINGWQKYELRDLRRDPSAVQSFPHRRWDGSSLRDKTLLIYAEQGVGDEIMFASVLPDAIRLAKRCIVECSERLVPLFSRSFPKLKVIPMVKGTLPEFLTNIDFAIPIGSLPLHFRRDITSFPQQRSYLVNHMEKTEEWRKRFSEIGKGPMIGISWRGGNEESVRRLRSTTLDQWADLFTVTGVQFINLQYGDCEQELREVKRQQGVDICDWEDADPLRDLDNFAAQIAALDLVITVDNSTLHMAGALGVPTWALLPKGNNWRWLQEVEDTPWYYNVRLFSQKILNDWTDVFKSVRDVLTSAVSDCAALDRLTHGVAVSYQDRKEKDRVESRACA